MKFSWNETLVWLCLLSNLIFAGSELISEYTGIDSWSIFYFGIGLFSVSVLILIYQIILKFKKNKKWKTNTTIMTKNTYYVLSFSIIGLAIIGGRYLGFSFIERLIAAFVIGGLFELAYRKKLKNKS